MFIFFNLSDNQTYFYRPNYKARLHSFITWPKYLPGPTPKELATAGFTYTGISDKVICYNCKVKLHSWEVQDDAVDEHFNHSPHCNYIKSIFQGFPLHSSLQYTI